MTVSSCTDQSSNTLLSLQYHPLPSQRGRLKSKALSSQGTRNHTPGTLQHGASAGMQPLVLLCPVCPIPVLHSPTASYHSSQQLVQQ